MTSLPPHVAVVIHDTKEMSQLTACTRSLKTAYRFHFLWLGLDAAAGQPVTQVLQLVFPKEALAGISTEASLFQSCEDNLEFA